MPIVLSLPRRHKLYQDFRDPNGITNCTSSTAILFCSENKLSCCLRFNIVALFQVKISMDGYSWQVSYIKNINIKTIAQLIRKICIISIVQGLSLIHI